MSLCHLPIYDPQKCTFFALGRNAIYAAVQAFKLEPGDEVLTPAFDCDGSLQPFRVLGLNLKFFRSNPYTFEVDIEDLKKRITPKTRLLHIINHFGFPQPWEELLSLRKTTGIPILEDNAYSLFSTYQGKQFGTFGDISIFSLRKNLPIIDGGMVRINNPEYLMTFKQKKLQWFYMTELPSMLRLLKTKMGIKRTPSLLKTIVPPPLYSDIEKDISIWPSRDCIGRDFSKDYLRPMSKLARFQLSLYREHQFQEIANKKREQYAFLAEQLSNVKGIKILWPTLPQGVVPFNISFLVEKNRDLILEKLRCKYSMIAWPTLPQTVLDQLDDFPDVSLLGKKILQLNFISRERFEERFEFFIKDFNK